MVTVKKPCHAPHSTQIITLGTIFTEIPFSVSKISILTYDSDYDSFVTNLKTLAKNLSVVRPKTPRRKRKRRKKRKAIAKLFCVTHKCKKKKNHFEKC